MLDQLKNHPFAVEAFFETSLVLTYAVPAAQLKALLPPCLAPDTFQENLGFVAVAVVQTRNLRPKGFPAFLGNDFILAGYRIFVRYTSSQGKRLRGLYILGSETDKTKMAFLGNIFTHYNYRATDLTIARNEDQIQVKSQRSRLDILIKTEDPETQLPAKSPFRDWKEARRYAGPLPFTFTTNENSGEVLIIEGVRENWVPKPVEVMHSQVGFLEKVGFHDAVLANAFMLQNIPYCWKKGRKDPWKAK